MGYTKMLFFGRDFMGFCKGRGLGVRERERERERERCRYNRGCNSWLLVVRRWRPQAPVIERISADAQPLPLVSN